MNYIAFCGELYCMIDLFTFLKWKEKLEPKLSNQSITEYWAPCNIVRSTYVIQVHLQKKCTVQYPMIHFTLFTSEFFHSFYFSFDLKYHKKNVNFSATVVSINIVYTSYAHILICIYVLIWSIHVNCEKLDFNSAGDSLYPTAPNTYIF